jgi:hypothetical protein
MEGGDEKEPLLRIAEALEKLASDPEVEIEAGPPICPSCGAFDPEIVLPDQESARGLMSEVIVQATCGLCKAEIYIVIESYSVHKGGRTATLEIEERKRGGFFGEVQ